MKIGAVTFGTASNRYRPEPPANAGVVRAALVQDTAAKGGKWRATSDDDDDEHYTYAAALR